MPVDLEVSATGATLPAACDMDNEGIEGREATLSAAIVKPFHERSHEVALTTLM